MQDWAVDEHSRGMEGAGGLWRSTATGPCLLTAAAGGLSVQGLCGGPIFALGLVQLQRGGYMHATGLLSLLLWCLMQGPSTYSLISEITIMECFPPGDLKSVYYCSFTCEPGERTQRGFAPCYLLN